MSPLRDEAEVEIADATGLGNVDQVNAIGNVASGTVSIPDPTVAGVSTLTLTGNATAALPTPSGGKRLAILVSQDGTGSRLLTVTSPGGGSVLWPGGRAGNVLSTAASSIDQIIAECEDGVNWICKLVKALAV